MIGSPVCFFAILATMNFRKWLLALIVTISIGYGTTTESSGEHSLGDEEELHNGNVLQPGAEQTTDISVLSSYLQAMMVKSERNVDPFVSIPLIRNLGAKRQVLKRAISPL